MNRVTMTEQIASTRSVNPEQKAIGAGSYRLKTKSLQSQYTTRHFIFTHINTGWKLIDKETSGIKHPIKKAFIGDKQGMDNFLNTTT